MSTIKIIKPVNRHETGDTINVTEGAATYLINAGYAEPASTPKPRRKAPQGGDSPRSAEQTGG